MLARETAPLSVLVFSPVFCDVSVVVVVVVFFHIAFIAARVLIACSLERRSGISSIEWQELKNRSQPFFFP